MKIERPTACIIEESVGTIFTNFLEKRELLYFPQLLNLGGG